jgi:molybdopterin molybdotransferase
VIPIENVMVEKKIIRLKEGFTFKKGSNVRTIGEDVQKNIRVIEKNQVIRSTNIQLLASCGKKYVRVFRKPVIAILASGNELIDIGKKPFNDKIRSSNYYSLLVSAAESGFEPFGFGIVNDSKKLLKQTIKKALNSNIDIFITSGGVSEGKYDFLPEIYKELGVTLKFHKVNIKPGKPILFGVYSLRNKKILIFGLPGNPVSCFINYILFIKNIFMELYTRDSGNKVKAELELSIAKKDNKTHFLRGVLIEREGINYVIPERNQSSANALGLSKANVLIKFPGEIKKFKKGSLVSCIKI